VMATASQWTTFLLTLMYLAFVASLEPDVS